MKRSTARSILATIQAIALFQIAAGFFIIPAVWRSGQSVVELEIHRGSEDAVEVFRQWVERKLHVTTWWIVGFGIVTFCVAGAATLIWRGRGDERGVE